MEWMRRALQTSDFDYHLPEDLIAQEPVEPRDRSRLMVVRREAQTWEHRTFAELPDLLKAGDTLVRNDTRVIPARLVGKRAAIGGHWEGLFVHECADGSREMMATTRGKPAVGERIAIAREFHLILVGRGESGRWFVRPNL
jgi:S-adenosylmethionine:tRNA ribosyltransferase-isomerase